jgi:hypothetical protein
MPSLMRFLTIIALIAGLFYGSMYVLAKFFPPKQHEISKAVRNIKLK